MKTWLYPLWVIIDVLLSVAVLGLWITAPEYFTLNIGLTAFAACLGVMLAFARRDSLAVLVKSAYFRKAAFHAVNAVLVISIMALVNYLGNKNYREFDITREKRNSLTEQTLKVLGMIRSPLKMTVFSKREEWAGILNLLKLYEAANKNVALEAVDTDLRPDLVKARGVPQNGTVIIDHEGKSSMFQVADELSVTNALLKAVRAEKIVLYFVTGHGELSCKENSAEGISQVCSRLTGLNYEIADLDLTHSKQVPKDASAVFILGPTAGLLDTEVAQLKTYLDGGGSLFLALAPAFKIEIYDRLVELAKPYGLTLGKDIVVDRLSTVQGSEATIPIITAYDPDHPVTAGFNQRTIFPLSSSVEAVAGKDGAVMLAFTSAFPGSWAEKDLKGVTEGKAAFQENIDKKGPVALFGVGETTESTTGSRFALLGSSSFLINAYQNQSGNTTLFLNGVSWLINDEGIISFNRPGLAEFPVILSAQHLQVIFVISIILVPIVFFGSAIFIYRRRRLL